MSQDDFTGIEVETFKQGIYSFVIHWLMYESGQLKVPVNESHKRPLEWVRSMCDDIERLTSQQETTGDNI